MSDIIVDFSKFTPALFSIAGFLITGINCEKHTRFDTHEEVNTLTILHGQDRVRQIDLDPGTDVQATYERACELWHHAVEVRIRLLAAGYHGSESTNSSDSSDNDVRRLPN